MFIICGDLVAGRRALERVAESDFAHGLHLTGRLWH